MSISDTNNTIGLYTMVIGNIKDFSKEYPHFICIICNEHTDQRAEHLAYKHKVCDLSEFTECFINCTDKKSHMRIGDEFANAKACGLI